MQEKGIFEAFKLSEPIKGEADLSDISKMELEELLALKAQIEEMLPPAQLTEMDLEREIVMQYHRAKALLAKVVADSSTPANQKAQVANSCAAALESLVKMQTKLYSAERMKAVEQVLIKALKTLPTATQEEFFVAYEKIHAEMQEAEAA